MDEVLLAGVQPSWIGLAVALGAGLLVGLERERRKGEGRDRSAAGIRSFALASMSGALSLWLASNLGSRMLVAVGALIVGLLAVLAYRRSRSDDPGVTTEIALFLMFLVGAVAMQDAVLGAGAGVIMAVLLAARTRLQRFATQWISEPELHDALLLAALALVLLPVLRAVPIEWLGTSPYALLRLLVVLLALQALGHVAQRLAGPRRGLWWAGLSSGLVSSTATVAALGARQRAHADLRSACVSGALASGVSTWGLAWGMTMAASPRLATAVAVPVAAGAAVTGLVSLLPMATRPLLQDSPLPDTSRMFQLGRALVIAGVLTGTTLASTLALRSAGQPGVWATAALSALADAHAAVGALANLAAAGALSASDFSRALLTAVAVNTVVRTVVAGLSGGVSYAWRVGCGLFAGWVAAGLLSS